MKQSEILAAMRQNKSNTGSRRETQGTRTKDAYWTRDAHMTRTAAQKARENDEKSEQPGEVINSVREADP